MHCSLISLQGPDAEDAGENESEEDIDLITVLNSEAARQT